jgi:hypothetical protein
MTAAIPASLDSEWPLAPVNTVDTPGNRSTLKNLRDESLIVNVIELP